MIGIIGGSGVYEITQKADSCTQKLVKTDYGDVEVSILDIFSKKEVYPLEFEEGKEYVIYFDKVTDLIVAIDVIE